MGSACFVHFETKDSIQMEMVSISKWVSVLLTYADRIFIKMEDL